MFRAIDDTAKLQDRGKAIGYCAADIVSGRGRSNNYEWCSPDNAIFGEPDAAY